MANVSELVALVAALTLVGAQASQSGLLLIFVKHASMIM